MHRGLSLCLFVPLVVVLESACDSATAGGISWVATTCSGDPCTLLPARSAGNTPTVQVAFKVVDEKGKPVPSVKVSFSLQGAPAGTKIESSLDTDNEGLVVSTVEIGPAIGSFNVVASAPGANDQARTALSPTIGIRGVRPTNGTMAFRCEHSTLLALSDSAVLPGSSTGCAVLLADRLGNPIGSPTTVQFKAEGGSLPASASTTPHSPDGDNAAEGLALATFSALGRPPLDVDPFPELPGQWPFARGLEPSAPQGPFTRNPRDGLVTLLAYTEGEEYFQDNNGDGLFQPGETFVDQGEPFVDANDNNAWDVGEFFLDLGEANRAYDGPNGKWDERTTIWAEARVLLTGVPLEGAPYATALLAPKGDLARGQNATLTARFLDANLNLSAAELTFSSILSGGRGQVAEPTSPNASQAFGFAWERRQVSADGAEAACGPSSPICKWKTLFYSWQLGGASAVVSNPAGDAGVPGPFDATIWAGSPTMKSLSATASGNML